MNKDNHIHCVLNKNTMKAIVSTKAFAMALKKAFDIDCHCIKWTDGDLCFMTQKYQMDFSFSIQREYVPYHEVYTFDNLKMVRLMDYLNNLPEQPIVLELDEDVDGVSIQLSQFIKTF